MSKYFDFISQIYSLVGKSKYRTAWSRVYHRILISFFKLRYFILRRQPTPIHAGTIKKDPILVYQMGKVGSRSVLFSLELAYLKHRLPWVKISHVHTLQNLDLHEKHAGEKQTTPLEIIHEYKKLRYHFDHDIDQHWNVISLVREPVGRSIGAFFQHIDRYIPGWQEKWKAKDLSLEDVMHIFLELDEIHIAPIWLDAELIPVLGIDLYTTAFPTEVGYQLYSKPPKIDLLVLRLEDLNRVGETAISNFLGIPNFSLYESNVSDEKEYAEIYNAFKSTPLPLEYLNKMYQTKYARHFYTDEELAAFTQKWSKTK